MKRFIIVDHSLVNHQGHHYECSISVAEAAQREGYEPLILASQAFQGSVDAKIRVYSLFAVDWLNQPIEPWQSAPIPTLPPQEWLSSSLLLEKVQGSTQRLKQWLKKDIELLRSVPFTHTAWGIFKMVWGLIRFLALSLGEVRGSRNINYKKQTAPAQDSFIATLAKSLEELQINQQDQIFIHTIGVEQIEELFHFLGVQPFESLPIFHLLLRRDPQEPLVVQAQGLGLSSLLWAYYESKLWPEKIRFYADTDTLVEKYHALSPVRLQQIPIPFRHEKLLKFLTPTDKSHRHLVYLGDARSEKGYQYLPELVADLWDDYLQPGKVHFTIQSNYNVAGGEAGILKAKLRLTQYPSQKVHLIEEPLQAEEYYQLLARADLVILPYDPQTYQRSSGVLTEALAAGKPVVVPANTWLSEQVDYSRAAVYQSPSHLSTVVRSALANLDNLAIAAQAYSYQWRAQQSPERLIEVLLGPPPPKGEIEPQVQRIFLILAAPHLKKELCHTSLSWQNIGYFCRAGYRVSLLVYGETEELTADFRAKLSTLGLDHLWFLTLDGALPSHWQQACNYYAQISLPSTVANFCRTFSPSLVWFDSPLVLGWLTRWGCPANSWVGWIEDLFTYTNAVQQEQEIDQSCLLWEIQQWQQCSLLVTSSSVQGEKLRELLPRQSVYVLQSQLSVGAQGTEFYNQQMNRILEVLLGDHRLPPLDFYPQPKVALLYPWGDLKERQSGASQRTGHLVDFLAEQGWQVGVFSIGSAPSHWCRQIYYNNYESLNPQGELIKQVYQDAYNSWQSCQNLVLESLDPGPPLDIEAGAENWLPWIYYIFRFDPHFRAWLEDIISWADRVILEYPFWAAIVGPLCRQQQIPLILTAHDVLAQQLAPQSGLGSIALTEELKALQQAQAVITLSPLDQAFFENYGIKNYCVPVGLDLLKIEQQLQESVHKLDPIGELKRDRLRPFCLFVGSQHRPNQQAVAAIKAWSQQENLDWDFVVVGSCCAPHTAPAFFSLGKVSAENLSQLYQQCNLVIIPLVTGTGMSVKTLEAMAYGKPILGTAIAFRGYPVESEVHCWQEDDLARYPQKIREGLRQPEKLQQMGDRARKLAQNYDYRQLYKTYLELLR